MSDDGRVIMIDEDVEYEHKLSPNPLLRAIVSDNSVKPKSATDAS